MASTTRRHLELPCISSGCAAASPVQTRATHLRHRWPRGRVKTTLNQVRDRWAGGGAPKPLITLSCCEMIAASSGSCLWTAGPRCQKSSRRVQLGTSQSQAALPGLPGSPTAGGIPKGGVSGTDLAAEGARGKKNGAARLSTSCGVSPGARWAPALRASTWGLLAVAQQKALTSSLGHARHARRRSWAAACGRAAAGGASGLSGWPCAARCPRPLAFWDCPEAPFTFWGEGCRRGKNLPLF